MVIVSDEEEEEKEKEKEEEEEEEEKEEKKEEEEKKKKKVSKSAKEEKTKVMKASTVRSTKKAVIESKPKAEEQPKGVKKEKTAKKEKTVKKEKKSKKCSVCFTQFYSQTSQSTSLIELESTTISSISGSSVLPTFDPLFSWFSCSESSTISSTMGPSLSEASCGLSLKRFSIIDSSKTCCNRIFIRLISNSYLQEDQLSTYLEKTHFDFDFDCDCDCDFDSPDDLLRLPLESQTHLDPSLRDR